MLFFVDGDKDALDINWLVGNNVNKKGYGGFDHD